jgi:hypothetical protein
MKATLFHASLLATLRGRACGWRGLGGIYVIGILVQGESNESWLSIAEPQPRMGYCPNVGNNGKTT